VLRRGRVQILCHPQNSDLLVCYASSSTQGTRRLLDLEDKAVPFFEMSTNIDSATQIKFRPRRHESPAAPLQKPHISRCSGVFCRIIALCRLHRILDFSRENDEGSNLIQQFIYFINK